MALVRKSNAQSESSVPKKRIVKVNPYENPDNVMELMASICSATPTADTNIYWDTINEAYNKEVRGKSLNDYLKDNRANLLNGDFEHELNDYCRKLSWNLAARENTEHTQIVVAGGFSSGKSSFLNRLTKCESLLPTGVEPVSVVKTYLYCSRNNRSITVKGVNQKNVLVNLNPGVLQAIQHAKKSNIFLASVLDKLFVEIPSDDLDGIVFIDTPGYNNSDKANQSNGKTDRETAIEALAEGNVLFWLVDCERGTTVTADIEIIKKFNGKKVFIFNKADKKGEAECKTIVEDAYNVLFREFPEDIIDVVAYSTLESRVYYSKNNMTLSSIVSEAKKSGNGTSEMNMYRDLIEMLFNEEISASQNAINNIEERYAEKLDRKNQLLDSYQAAKEDQNDIVKDLNDLIVKNYSEVLRAAENLGESSLNALNNYCEFINAMYHWDSTDHDCWNNTLTPIIDRFNRYYGTCCDKHNNAIKYQYYNLDYRKEVVERLNKEEDIVVERFREWYEDACRDCENALEGKSREQSIIKDMQEYRNLFMSALDLGIKMYQQQNKATVLQSTGDYVVPNVFESIKKDDYKSFLRSFENGVDLLMCDAEGYNPLTLAVNFGNNTMVQFLLDHDADPSILDRRGYNAFHTAVENQFRDICSILLDVDPDLVDSKTVNGESVKDLANKHTFSRWIENEIENAL